MSGKIWLLISSPQFYRPHRLSLRDLKYNNDDDSSKNVIQKMHLRPFKLYRVYFEPLNSSNVGDFFWSWLLTDFIHHAQIEKGKFVIVCPRPPRRVRRFHVIVVQWTSKKCNKKAWCTCRAVVLLIKLLVFCPRCRCRRRCRSCLSSLCPHYHRRTGNFLPGGR